MTLITVGVPSMSYLLGLAWHSVLGERDRHLSDNIKRMGIFSLYGLGAWIIQYFVVGIMTLVRG